MSHVQVREHRRQSGMLRLGWKKGTGIPVRRVLASCELPWTKERIRVAMCDHLGAPGRSSARLGSARVRVCVSCSRSAFGPWRCLGATARFHRPTTSFLSCLFSLPVSLPFLLRLAESGLRTLLARGSFGVLQKASLTNLRRGRFTVDAATPSWPGTPLSAIRTAKGAACHASIAKNQCFSAVPPNNTPYVIRPERHLFTLYANGYPRRTALSSFFKPEQLDLAI